jgi:hypothetical protein
MNHGSRRPRRGRGCISTRFYPSSTCSRHKFSQYKMHASRKRTASSSIPHRFPIPIHKSYQLCSRTRRLEYPGEQESGQGVPLSKAGTRPVPHKSPETYAFVISRSLTSFSSRTATWLVMLCETSLINKEATKAAAAKLSAAVYRSLS